MLLLQKKINLNEPGNLKAFGAESSLNWGRGVNKEIQNKKNNLSNLTKIPIHEKIILQNNIVQHVTQ